jgi:hypothetical protein
MVGKTAVTLGAAALIALGVAGVSLASGSGGETGHVRVLRVLDLTKSVKLIDTDQSKGYSVGDLVVIRTQLRSLDGKRQLGNAFIHCVAITLPQSQCTGTYRLRGGDVTFSGLAPGGGAFSVAVTGGTGQFDRYGAGTIRIRNTNASGNRSIDTITLKG